jgi:hypothetical protein
MIPEPHDLMINCGYLLHSYLVYLRFTKPVAPLPPQPNAAMRFCLLIHAQDLCVVQLYAAFAGLFCTAHFLSQEMVSSDYSDPSYIWKSACQPALFSSAERSSCYAMTYQREHRLLDASFILSSYIEGKFLACCV